MTFSIQGICICFNMIGLAMSFESWMKWKHPNDTRVSKWLMLLNIVGIIFNLIFYPW